MGAAGNLVVWLGMDNEPLVSGFAKAGGAAKSWAGITEQSASKAKVGLMGLSTAALAGAASFSRGDGLAGAVQSVGPGLVVLLSAINPIAGAVGAAGLAIANLLIPALSEGKDKTADFAAELSKLDEMANRLSGAGRSRLQFEGRLQSSDSRAELESLHAGLIDERRGLDSDMAALRTVQDQAITQFDAGEGDAEGLAKKIAELEEKVNAKLREREEIERRILETRKKVPEIRAGESFARAQEFGAEQRRLADVAAQEEERRLAREKSLQPPGDGESSDGESSGRGPPAFAEALSKGSAEAFATIVRAQSQANTPEAQVAILQQQLVEQRRTREAIERMRRSAERPEVIGA